jgi:flagellum-specific peptidoglycan hydrolase FlgJ
MDGFIAKVAPMFQKYGAQYKFHIISFAIAQACYESAWGDSYAATHYNNILGIGPHKHYSSWDACVKGYYTDTVLGGMASARNATTIDAYYSAFLASGYCADPDRSYYNAIKSIINSNNLTKYDAKNGQPLSGGSSTSGTSTNNKIAWDYLVGQKKWSKTAAAACIGCWLAENGYHY